MNLPSHLPQAVHDAWAVFSDEEQRCISAMYDQNSGDFIGFGFEDPETGKFTRFTDPAKVAAVDVLERQYVSELMDIQGTTNFRDAGWLFNPVQWNAAMRDDCIEVEFEVSFPLPS